jgi:Uma2 family endonuclease
MSARPEPHLTPEQYLELDRASEFRNEYYNGRMYAMSGGSYSHAVVIARLSRALGNALDGRPCGVTSSDVRVCVGADGLYTYPDIVVVCGDPKFADGRSDTLLNPTLVIEVLSPSTEAYDRGFKFAQYRRVESLEEYALVLQIEPRVEVFRRQEGGHWLLSEFVGLEAVAHFNSVDASVPLARIYNRIVFDAAEQAPLHPADE